jgi:PPE-repeat protein
MDINVGVPPNWGVPDEREPVGAAIASDRGAGPLGFAGTVTKQAAAQAAGLTTLSGDGFGSGPTMPMVPGTWNTQAEEGGEHG